MNDATPATDQPHTCAHCRRPLTDTDHHARICWPCQDHTDQRLNELPTLYTRLRTAAALTPGTTGPRAGTTTGSGPIHAPLPLRLDVLNLTAAGGIPTRLQAIEDAWRIARRWTIPTHPAHTAAPHARFLRMNLTWACTNYPEIGDDLAEIRRIHTAATNALDTTPQPGRIQVGACPIRLDDQTICGTPLTATTARHTITCTRCDTRWTTLTDWRDLQAAQAALTRCAA